MARTIGGCAGLLLLLGLATGAAAQSPPDPARLEELKENIETLKDQLQQARANRSDLLEELESSETKMSELQQKVEQLRRELQDKQTSLDTVTREREALLTEKKQQQQSVAQALDAAYRLGRESRLKVLLSQQDPAALSRNYHLLNYVLAARQRELAAYQRQLQLLAEAETRLNAAKAQVTEARARVAEELAALQQARRERAATLAKIEATINTQDAKLKQAEREREQLAELLAKVTMISDRLELAASGTAIAKLKGKLHWPAAGKLGAEFGAPRLGGRLKWQGILIQAPEGAPVRAVHSGRVVFADYLRGQGLLVIVDHGDDMLSLYGHNRALTTQVGSWVAAGDVIAQVGASGGQAESGVYFELRAKGAPVNPRAWLAPAQAAG